MYEFKAFSVAEALVALAIGGIVLGMSAPLISKQVQNQNFNDVQFRILADKLVPSGAVMYFDLDSCPDGWRPLSEKYSQASGAFIRNLGETVPAGSASRAKGSYQSSALPDIKLALRMDYPIECPKKFDIYGQEDANGVLYVGNTGLTNEPVCDVSAISEKNRPGDLIKSDIYQEGVNEVRPNNIALLACRKK